MKKLILLALTTLLTNCSSIEDPLKYKGCVVIEKQDVKKPFSNIYLKLTPEMREKYKSDYIWIRVPNWEYNKLNIGDTIR